MAGVVAIRKVVVSEGATPDKYNLTVFVVNPGEGEPYVETFEDVGVGATADADIKPLVNGVWEDIIT